MKLKINDYTVTINCEHEIHGEHATESFLNFIACAMWAAHRDYERYGMEVKDTVESDAARDIHDALEAIGFYN